MSKVIATPECNKLQAVHIHSQVCGEFLNWILAAKGYEIAVRHFHVGNFDEGGECFRKHDCTTDVCITNAKGCFQKFEKVCGVRDNALVSVNFKTEKLLAEFFGIDMNKVENERRQILKSLRIQAKKHKKEK